MVRGERKGRTRKKSGRYNMNVGLWVGETLHGCSMLSACSALSERLRQANQHRSMRDMRVCLKRKDRREKASKIIVGR